jgi:integrase
MTPPRRGRLKRRRTSQGTSYGVSFDYSGEEFYVHFGGDWEGWSAERAADEQRYLMGKVNRGEWKPPVKQAPVKPAPAEKPTFQVEASEWLHRRKLKAGDPEGTSSTIGDLVWRLRLVMDKFGAVPLDQLDYALADELVSELCEERLEIERARERGTPLKHTITTKNGLSFEARRRSISNSSIRKALDATERVLRDAKKRGVLTGDLPDLKSAAPKSERPNRSFLEIEQIAALLKAADLIEAEHRGLTWQKVAMIRASDQSARALARELGVSDTLVRRVRNGELWKTSSEDRNRNDVPRRVIVETLVFAGLRISEFCGLDAHHLDIAAGRLRVPRTATKTDAGERVIPIVPVLRERLTEHRMDYPVKPTAAAFPTRNGTRQSPDNIRSRVLNPLKDRANELLAAEGKLPIGHMTPHTLRRTFASVIAVCDVSPRRAMYLMGHTDPSLTLGVYQQVMDVSDQSLDLLEDLIGCSLDDAETLFDGGSRRSRRGVHPGTIPERGVSGLSPEPQQ